MREGYEFIVNRRWVIVTIIVEATGLVAWNTANSLLMRIRTSIDMNRILGSANPVLRSAERAGKYQNEPSGGQQRRGVRFERTTKTPTKNFTGVVRQWECGKLPIARRL